jgi:DNA-binding transcriptional LysR family regulator
MNVTIKQLRAAVALVRCGTFRGAAEAMHVSPPALSIAISELERALGVSLFDRTSRRVRTSEAGARFTESAQRVLADIDRMLLEIGDVAAARRGTVTIACVASIASRILPPSLLRMAKSYPEIDVRLIDDFGAQVVAAVKDRHADFGLTTAPAEPSGDLAYEPIHDDPLYLAFPKGHRLTGRRVVCWSDINGERLIGLKSSAGSFEVVDRQLRAQSIRPEHTLAVSHLSVAHAMVEAGLGVCVLPQTAIPGPIGRTRYAAPLQRPRISRSIVMCRLRDRSLSPAATAALGIIRGTFAEPDSWR